MLEVIKMRAHKGWQFCNKEEINASASLMGFIGMKD